MKKFVIVVDMQKDFVNEDGKLYVPGSSEIIQPINDYLASLSKDDTIGVLFTLDSHYDYIYPDSEEAKQFPPHCYKGSIGWELAVDKNLIHRMIPVFKLEKNVFNMWEQSHLEIMWPVKSIPGSWHTKFRELFFKSNRVTNDVVVIGVASDYCVKYTIEGLLERGFNVTVPRALVKGISMSIDEVAEKLSLPITIV